MLSAVRDRQTLEPQASSRDEIGLIGPPKSGATGLVWSLLANSSLGVSPFAADWRLERAAAPDPGTEADELPLYLNPYWSPPPRAEGDKKGVPMTAPPAEFVRRMSHFAIAPVFPGGWPVTRHRRAFEIIERSELRKDQQRPARPGLGGARLRERAPYRLVPSHGCDTA